MSSGAAAAYSTPFYQKDERVILRFQLYKSNSRQWRWEKIPYFL